MIIIITIAITACLIAPVIIYNNEGNTFTRNKMLIVITLTSAGLILEFLLHYFQLFHSFGGFFYIILLSFAVIEGSVAVYDTFAIAPPALTHFLLMTFAGLFYSKYWFTATIAQVIGYGIIFIFAWTNFASKMVIMRLVSMEISMVVGLIAISFIYYYVESLQRMSIFQQWQTDQVTNFITYTLGVKLLETIFAYHSCRNCHK